MNAFTFAGKNHLEHTRFMLPAAAVYTVALKYEEDIAELWNHHRNVCLALKMLAK